MTCHTPSASPEAAFADDYAPQFMGAPQSAGTLPLAPPGHPSRKGRGKGAPGFPRKPRNAKSAVRNLSTRLCVSDQMKLMAALTARNESVFNFVRRAVIELAAREGITLTATPVDYTPRRPSPVSFSPRLKD